MLDRKNPDCLGANVGRNIDIKSASPEVSDRNEEHIMGNLRKGDHCDKVAKNLAKLCSSALWKVELINEQC